MKASLKTQLGQQLHLTPQLLQSIRLLQLDAQQLELEIVQALETNPLLEREDSSGDEDLSPSESAELIEALGHGDAVEQGERVLDDYEVIHEPYQDEEHSFAEDWSAARSSYDGDDDPIQRLSEPTTGQLRQSVLEQLQLGLTAPADLAAAAWLVESVDDNGYLDLPLAQLQADAQRLFGLDPSRLEGIRQQMLRGDPCGYGALDLAECLRVQLEELPDDTDGKAIALRLVNGYLEQLASNDASTLCRSMGITADALHTAHRLMLGLQPRPGQQLPEDPGHYIVPDVRVIQRNGVWQVALNHASAPRLRVNPVYEQMLGSTDTTAGSQRLRELLQEARWLTRGLAMRYDTLLRTATVIVERQQGFLNRGDEAMLPLTLRDIADAIGMHESTVSRITTGKYLQTPRGTFELKYFFSTKLDGATVANTAIRAMVRRLIDAESPSAPLADDTIALMLARQGIHIARRTVAKYRDQLQIGPAKLRHRSNTPQPGRPAARPPVTTDTHA